MNPTQIAAALDAAADAIQAATAARDLPDRLRQLARQVRAAPPPPPPSETLDAGDGITVTVNPTEAVDRDGLPIRRVRIEHAPGGPLDCLVSAPDGP